MLSLNVKTIKQTTLRLKVVAGTIYELGRPVAREIRAYSRSSGTLLTKSQSDKNGKYKIYLPYDAAYTIVSVDHNREFNSVIQDVVPK